MLVVGFDITLQHKMGPTQGFWGTREQGGQKRREHGNSGVQKEGNMGTEKIWWGTREHGVKTWEQTSPR